jgi:hypothetical protein
MLRGLLTITLAVAAAAPVAAQAVAGIEALAGYAGFLDESAVDHTAIGGAARVHVTPRVSLGPEVVYMRGPGFDRDWFVTFNGTFDFVAQGARQPRRRVNPFLVAGVGVMRHTDRFVGQAFSSSEGAFTAGGGARVWVADRVYAFGEVRGGWEPHVRVNGGIGVRFR